MGYNVLVLRTVSFGNIHMIWICLLSVLMEFQGSRPAIFFIVVVNQSHSQMCDDSSNHKLVTRWMFDLSMRWSPHKRWTEWHCLNTLNTTIWTTETTENEHRTILQAPTKHAFWFHGIMQRISWLWFYHHLLLQQDTSYPSHPGTKRAILWWGGGRKKLISFWLLIEMVKWNYGNVLCYDWQRYQRVCERTVGSNKTMNWCVSIDGNEIQQ